MRHSILVGPIVVLALLLCAPAADAAFWYSSGNNKSIFDPNTWTDAANSGTKIPALPTAGDTDTFYLIDGDRLGAASVNGVGGNGSTFYGGTLDIGILGTNDSELQLWNLNLTVQDVVLNGGAINIGKNSGSGAYTLTGNTLTLNSGIIGHEMGSATRTAQYDFDSYEGSGDIYLVARGNGATATSKLGNILFIGGGDFSGFDGMFIIGDSTTAGFGYNITGGTFGITVEDAGGTTYHAKYNLLNSVTVDTLTLGTEKIVPGTYSFGDFTATQQAYFKDSGGSVTVLTPEPATLGLLVLGAIPLIFRKRRKA